MAYELKQEQRLTQSLVMTPQLQLAIKLLQLSRIELVEMVRNRERTWCCGGGGGLKGVDYDLSLEIGKDKVKEALATGAGTIVSACPSCKTSISDAVRATGAKLKVKDITELAIEAGIQPV